MRFLICNCVVLLCLVAGCAKAQATRRAARAGGPSAFSPHATTQPILYHRTGGIAGTDDRVVIWSDGFVEVYGKLLAPATGQVPAERLEKLVAMFDGWSSLRDNYQDSKVADAYTIAIHFGGKSVTADDIAPDLPPKFRKIFTEIEAIATSVETTTPNPAPTTPAPGTSPVP